MISLFVCFSLPQYLIASEASPTEKSSKSFCFSKKKKSSKQTEKIVEDKYSQIANEKNFPQVGVFRVYQKGVDFYFEIPHTLFNRDMLIVNKVLKVPRELNDAGINKGINYENNLIKFEFDKKADRLLVRNVRPLPDYPEEDAIAQSVRDNYISPLIGSLKIEAHGMWGNDSTVLVKVNELYDGTKTIFSNLFNNISIGGSAIKDLSRIIEVKAFENNITVVSELTTKVDEGHSSVYVTVERRSSIVLLPEKPMVGRFLSKRVGYFTVPFSAYSDSQNGVEKRELITRWRLEPKQEDIQSYLDGNLVEPISPITFYIDNSTPPQWRKYMKKGIEDWQKAFERAGFKNAIQAKDLTDSLANDPNDVKYSTVVYVASDKMNAMGPSVYDPRSGEIIEADIIWWHNVLSMLKNWIITQTGAVQPSLRLHDLPEELVGEAMRFVACHEVGHSLGLRHNMIASSAYPTDSLRSNSFVKKHGVSASIMDYARYNYIAQPEDGVENLSPQIGPYDLFAIEYGYRWSSKAAASEEEDFLWEILKRHQGREYRYSEAQDSRSGIDPRSQTEDLGDDPVKSSELGIANLKRIVPRIVEISATNKDNQSYSDAGKLYYAIINHWNNLVYHPLANIGGIYLENTYVGDGKHTYAFVPKSDQKKAVEFLIKELITNPHWLFNLELSDYTFPIKDSPDGYIETAPSLILKNAQSYIFWDILDNRRLIRMSENERINKQDAFTSVELMDMLHAAIFGVTRRGQNLDVYMRSVQKGFVDALIQAVSKEAVSKKNKLTIQNEESELKGISMVKRNVNFYGSLADRISDAISVKRGELLRIKSLLEKKKNNNTATQYHYDDLLLRINNYLDL